MKTTSTNFFPQGFTLICFAILTLLFASCKKVDKDSDINLPQGWKEKFFKLPENAPSILQRIAAKIKGEDNRTGFLENFVKEQGYIRWEYARIKNYKPRNLNIYANEGGASNPTIVFLPVVPETEEIVKSFISSIVSDDIVFKLYEANKYAENGFDMDPDRIKPNANDIVEKLMKFEAQIFDAQVFNVKDNRLFSYRPASVVVPPSFL